jgi:hypothetical protein
MKNPRFMQNGNNVGKACGGRSTVTRLRGIAIALGVHNCIQGVSK